MNSGDQPASVDLPLDAFLGPSRLRHVLPVLRRVPRPVAEQVLAAMSIGDALVRGTRFRQARAWALCQNRGWMSGTHLALAVLANHGRFVAEEALVGITTAEDLRAHVSVRGREHLDACRDGALLVGFHLGPPNAWLALMAAGYPVRFAGRLEVATRDPRWHGALDAGAAVRLPAASSIDRTRALYELRRLLRDGNIVYLTADGPLGAEAFHIDLAGGPLIVRRGWLALRRDVGVPTLPVLSHMDGSTRVVTIHPPLPHPQADPQQDAETCRATLTPLIDAYLKRYPSQCRWLAIRWSSADDVRGEDA